MNLVGLLQANQDIIDLKDISLPSNAAEQTVEDVVQKPIVENIEDSEIINDTPQVCKSLKII